MREKDPTDVVLGIGTLAFEGHIVPHSWYEHVTYETDGGKVKVDLQAIAILSDVVYWYRPRRVVDEATGKQLRLERRFASDKLQRNYQQIADQFGLSKTQAARACKRLVDLGLITMEFRTVDTARGPIPNVLYLEPVVERIAEITHGRVRTSPQIRKDTPSKMPTYPVKNVKTNTENTTENTDREELPSPPATPVTFQGWLEAIRSSGNRNAVVRGMHEALFPDRPPPDYGYVGAVARRVGGHEVLAMRLWECATRPPVGDVLAYVQGIKRREDDAPLAQMGRLKERLRQRQPVIEGEAVVI